MGDRAEHDRDRPSTIEPLEAHARFIDDELEGTLARQVVILGSGLDTRAWRLEWPDGTRVYEIDSEQVVAFLTASMDAAAAVPACVRVPLAADVTAPWASRIVASGLRMPCATAALTSDGLVPKSGRRNVLTR